MTSVGFVIHEGRPAAVDAAGALPRLVGGRRYLVHHLHGGAADVDLVVAVGGDGTFLRGAYVAAQPESRSSASRSVGSGSSPRWSRPTRPR